MQEARSIWTSLAAIALVVAIGGCGGSGDRCEQLGPVEFHYAPSVVVGTDEALTYKLGQANSWSLTVRGVTQACLAGLKVAVPVGRPPLPVGLSLDAATGRISSGVLASAIEGYCATATGTIVGPSVGRACPTGQTYKDNVYVLVIASDYVNKTDPIVTPITFSP